MKIANNINDVTRQLKSLYSSENEIRWTRAAIVYAFLESEEVDCVLDFANMKLRGLSSPRYVSSYRAIWKTAMEQGIAKHVKPGDPISLPKADFQPYWEASSAGGQTSRRRKEDRNTDWTSNTPDPTEKDHSTEPVARSPYARTQKALELLGAAARMVESSAANVEDIRIGEEALLEFHRATRRIHKGLLRLTDAVDEQTAIRASAC